MENFVRLLKKTIDAQSNVTPQLRQLIYERARVTIEKKLSQNKIPETVALQQKELLEKAILAVEASYKSQVQASEADTATTNPILENDDASLSKSETSNDENLDDNKIEPESSKNDQDETSSTVVEKETEDANNQKDDLGLERLGDILKPQAERKALAAAKKKRWIFSILVLLLLLIIGGAAYWILNPLAQNTKPPVATPQTETPTTTQTEKIAYRLNPDGSETLASPQKPQDENTKGQTTAEATPKNIINTNLAQATLYLTQTENQTEKIQTGDVEWVEARDISDSGVDLGPIIRGNIAIPVDINGGKFIALMTIHPNRDETIPATYIIDLIFVTPDGYKEGPVEKILDLRFKPTEQIPGQQLAGVTYETIGDNFFLLPMSSAGTFADNNLRLMRQMPWIRIVAQLKSGRMMELTFKKGEKGTEIFDKVIGEWLGDTPAANATTPSTSIPTQITN